VETVERILEDFSALFKEGKTFTDKDLRDAFAQIAEDRAYSLKDYFTVARFNPSGKKQVAPKSANQRRYIESIQKNDIVFGVGVAGTGKCIKSDSLVLTSQGMVQISELGSMTEPGCHSPLNLNICGLDGPEATSHIYNGGQSETLRITTRLGYAIETTYEHPLLVLNEDGLLEWRRADQLQPGDALALQRGERMFGDHTDINFQYTRNGPNDRTSKPVMIETLDPEFAYFMGLLTGDGCLTRPNKVLISSADEQIVDAFHAMASRFKLHVFRNGPSRYDYVIGSSQLYQLLKHLGMSTGGAYSKHIPRSILVAPEEQVTAFLRGLFDTDGTIEKRDGVITLSSVSERLIREVHIVLLNFGIVCSKGIKHGRYKGEPHLSHRLTITGADAELFHDLIGFGLERKRARRLFRGSNTNVDVVPHIGPIIKAAMRGTSFSRAEHQLFGDYRREYRRPSYQKLTNLVDILMARGLNNPSSLHLGELLNRHLLFLEVSSIAPSTAQVYDLTVPGTHSFVANGFINHNTYIAVAMAVQALMQKQVSRIVLARPAVEAGEKLGFLPGDLQDKVDPYLRPLYDAVFDLIDAERVTKLLEKRIIEVAPLAFMRGRSQPLNSKVLTPEGWRTMGSLSVGDEVIGSDGRPKTVLGVFPQGRRPVYRITMTDGASTLACGEHLWAVRTPEDKRDNKPSRVLETQEMYQKLRRFQKLWYELPVLSSPVEWPHRDVPIDPYSLGLLLGDGCISCKTSPGFATSDSELVTALRTGLSDMNLTVRYKSRVDYSIVNLHGHRNPLMDALRDLSLSGTHSSTKFVPDLYLYNSADVRLAVLQGLLDTDGWTQTQAGRSCRIQYCTTSSQLKDNVLFLVRSLGGVATYRIRRAEGRRPGFAHGRDIPHRHDAYVLEIRLPSGIEPFRLKRKAEVYNREGLSGRPMRYIDSIEPAGEEETQCITVAAIDSLYVTDDFILTHNTLSDAFIILDEAQNTTTEQMKMFLTRIGFGSKAVITGDVTQIDLPTGKRSGLVEAERILSNIEGIDFIYFSDKDVVRHKLVQMIIKAYEESTKKSI
jgi:phosphate starvation-inducible protein PhoH and related proteins